MTEGYCGKHGEYIDIEEGCIYCIEEEKEKRREWKEKNEKVNKKNYEKRLLKSAKTLKEHCYGRDCRNCIFVEEVRWSTCKLRNIPGNWKMDNE